MNTQAVRGEKKLICPSCKKNLVTAITDGAEVDVCAACGGVWVDFIDERALLNIQPQSFTVDELRRLRKIYEPLGKLDAVKYRNCPICEDLMYRRNWGGNSGVIVDRCEKHGCWYEPGEIEKIREYIALGGVEFEKLRLHESAASELRAKLNKEVSRLDARISADNHLISRLFTAIIYK